MGTTVVVEPVVIDSDACVFGIVAGLVIVVCGLEIVVSGLVIMVFGVAFDCEFVVFNLVIVVSGLVIVVKVESSEFVDCLCSRASPSDSVALLLLSPPGRPLPAAGQG